MATGCDHCPFLNRADTRCSQNFQLDSLGHAFRHCFGQFKTCPTYIELLVERRIKRVTAEHAHRTFHIPLAARDAQHAAAG
jgi:hypothetical protein